MPRVQGLGEGILVNADLVEAGLDTAFALLRLAETQSNDDARRLLREARAVCRESQRRASQLRDADFRRVQARFDDLRRAFRRASGRHGGARILRMPAR